MIRILDFLFAVTIRSPARILVSRLCLAFFRAFFLEISGHVTPLCTAPREQPCTLYYSSSRSSSLVVDLLRGPLYALGSRVCGEVT